ncbi:PPA1309 family protein [Angustibacter sp. McL0619]|uniref:PPA1309 family protein n=1 Tax=Angustibacter sp. McL0619 TaxID=3415676 RepID=UPI003CE85522
MSTVTEHPDPADSLTRALLETERHVGSAGWDQPPRLFALVRTATLLEREPALRSQLEPGAITAADADPGHLIAIEQEGLPATSHLESILGQLAWGPDVDGVALSIERVVVPPEAERDLPPGPEEAVEYLAAHPARQDVRLVVAVLRGGEHQCGVRQRQQDDASSVAVGPDLVPGLVAALTATLQD